MFEVILAPTDGSAHATRAVSTAIDLAVRYDARLIVLHALLRHATAEEIRHVLVGSEIDSALQREIDGLRSVSAPLPVGGRVGRDTPSRALADRVADHVVGHATKAATAAGIEGVGSMIVPGNAARQIVEAVKREKVQLLVMGTRGLGGLQGILHGSVSQSVRNACGCACLTIP